MILVPALPDARPPTAQPESAYVDTVLLEGRVTEVLADQRPDQFLRLPFRFDRTVLAIEGGQLMLRLREPLMVELDQSNWRCNAVGWNVSVVPHEIAQLPQQLARKFLTLFSKVDRGIQLDSDEQATWVNILERVDFRRFSVDRAAPRYMEGTITGRQLGFVRVKWHDDTVQRIDRPVAAALDALQVGDEFGAYVKLGLDDEVQAIDRLSILSTG